MEVFYKGVTAGKVKWMQEYHTEHLVRHLAESHTNGDVNLAFKILSSLRTMACLLDPTLDFWWKPEAELQYLVDKELDGDMVAWEKQAW